MNHSSLIVEVSHDEEEQELQDEQEDDTYEHHNNYNVPLTANHARNNSPPRETTTITPLEPDGAQSPVQEASFFMGATDELLLRKPRVAAAVVEQDDEPQPDDLYFLFPPELQDNKNNHNTASVTTLQWPSTPAALLVDSQLQELESKSPKTPQDARQWLQTAVVALQEARSEREAARQWARDMKEAVHKWTTEQQRLVQLQASSHLGETLSRLESHIVDLKSMVHNHHEQQDSSQSHLQDLLQQQQSTLHDLCDQFPPQMKEPLVSPATTTTTTLVATSPPGRVAGLPRQSLDGSTSSSRVQRQLPNGAGRLIVYSSGVEKELHTDGTTVIRFPNRDVETTLPDKKTVAYYHATEQVMQITQPDQSVLLEYPNGQVERHYIDGSKAILFPNGLKVKLDPRGDIQGSYY
jgi:T-complex protein 10 C-terminus